MSFNRALFDEFVGSLNLRFFKPGELLSRQYLKPNGPPPIELWHNIVPTVMVLEELRAVIDSPVRIICAYRNEAYNNNGNKGRAKLSQHQAYSAIDFQVPGKDVEQVGKIVAAWNGTRWFGSAIPFQRRATKVSAGTIPFGEVPQRSAYNDWSSDHPFEFMFRGFVKVYPQAGSRFIHIDTRGLAGEDDED